MRSRFAFAAIAGIAAAGLVLTGCSGAAGSGRVGSGVAASVLLTICTNPPEFGCNAPAASGCITVNPS